MDSDAGLKIDVLIREANHLVRVAAEQNIHLTSLQISERQVTVHILLDKIGQICLNRPEGSLSVSPANE